MSTTATPMTTFNMRMSADLKKNLEDVCRQMGLSVSAAITMSENAVFRSLFLPIHSGTRLHNGDWNTATLS